MSETFEERLSRFTPDRSALNRDALLFAAGRASARAGRRWAAVAAVLAVTQISTLTVLWPREVERRTPVAVVSPELEPQPLPREPAPPAEPSSLWVLQRQLLNDPNDVPKTIATDELVPDEPPLRAFGRLPESLLQ